MQVGIDARPLDHALQFGHQLYRVVGWCQTNSNQSLQGQRACPLCRAELTPLGESGGSVQLEIGSGVEAAFLVEMV